MGNWFQRLWQARPAPPPNQPPPPPNPAPNQQEHIIQAVVPPEPNAGPVGGPAPQLVHPNEQVDRGGGRAEADEAAGHSQPGAGGPNPHPNDREEPHEGSGGAEAAQPLSKPYGRKGYPFDDPLEVSLVQSDSNIGSIREVQTTALEISKQYNTLVALREGVRSSLRDFKVALGKPKTAELTACFNALKSAAGRQSQIEIVQYEDEECVLEIDAITLQQLGEQTQTAVLHFNNLLKDAHEFLRQKQENLDVIREKLAQMEERYQYQVSIDQYNQVKDTPAEIDRLAGEITRFLHDMHIAKSHLEDRVAFGRSTGMIALLN